ncbi:unnamed protein product [Musa textilis]
MLFPVGRGLNQVMKVNTVLSRNYVSSFYHLCLMDCCLKVFNQWLACHQLIIQGLTNHQSMWLADCAWRVLAGAEVAVLCLTKSGDVFNYQAFTNSKGVYKVAETMPESDRWVSCLARPLSSFHEHCTRRGDTHSGIKFSYNLPSGHSHTVKPFLYKPAAAPMYCS